MRRFASWLMGGTSWTAASRFGMLHLAIFLAVVVAAKVLGSQGPYVVIQIIDFPLLWCCIAPFATTDAFGFMQLYGDLLVAVFGSLMWGVFGLYLPRGWQVWVSHHPRHPPGYCQQCGYDLTGNVSGTCPECGTDIKKP